MSFWWVNQGQSYAAERRAGILWAPVRTDAGFDLVHWSSMTKVVNGDVIFNYAAGHLRAVSVAFGPEELAVRPVDLQSQWPSEGRLVRVEMTDIVPPIPLETIPEAARLAEPKVGPFDRRGMVKQGYLFPISEGLGEDLLALIGVEMTTSQASRGRHRLRTRAPPRPRPAPNDRALRGGSRARRSPNEVQRHPDPRDATQQPGP